MLRCFWIVFRRGLVAGVRGVGFDVVGIGRGRRRGFPGVL